jgi:cytochrome c oxidase subunit 2
VFFFVLITVLMGVFVWKYRGRRGQGTTATHDHNTALELTWTIIPTLIVVAIFWIGFETYLNMATPPQNAMTIQVTGQKWKWLFTYPNGWVDESLHVPVDTDVALVMTSEDVIHSFYVPAFRVKKDVVPGRYNRLWFNAREPGEYQAYCTEYCGTDHSAMLATVVVHEPGGYETWLADASNLFDKYTLPEIGEIYYTKFGCKSCHSLDGTRVIGPSFKGIWEAEHVLVDGSRVIVDENYIRESILEPQAKVVAGYDPVMPTFKGRFKDEDITAMIEFIKTHK